MKTGVFMRRDRVRKVLDAISLLPTRDVLVGIPEDETARERGEPITNAALLYIHENGAPEANIPARPSLIPGIAEAKDKIAAKLRDAGKASLQGEKQRAERNLQAAGLIGQAAARHKMNTGPFEPLKPSTLAARRRRGRTGEKPLIDTGQLRNAINYVIRSIRSKVVLR